MFVCSCSSSRAHESDGLAIWGMCALHTNSGPWPLELARLTVAKLIKSRPKCARRFLFPALLQARDR